MKYYENRKRAQFKNVDPTMTDQSQARYTDINVIVRNYLTTGQAPRAATQPQYGDFAKMPIGDLRAMIELARSSQARLQQLPEALRAIPQDQLLHMTEQEIAAILTPATTAPTPPQTDPPT